MTPEERQIRELKWGTSEALRRMEELHKRNEMLSKMVQEGVVQPEILENHRRTFVANAQRMFGETFIPGSVSEVMSHYQEQVSVRDALIKGLNAEELANMPGWQRSQLMEQAKNAGQELNDLSLKADYEFSAHVPASVIQEIDARIDEEATKAVEEAESKTGTSTVEEEFGSSVAAEEAVSLNTTTEDKDVQPTLTPQEQFKMVYDMANIYMDAIIRTKNTNGSCWYEADAVRKQAVQFSNDILDMDTNLIIHGRHTLTDETLQRAIANFRSIGDLIEQSSLETRLAIESEIMAEMERSNTPEDVRAFIEEELRMREEEREDIVGKSYGTLEEVGEEDLVGGEGGKEQTA